MKALLFGLEKVVPKRRPENANFSTVQKSILFNEPPKCTTVKINLNNHKFRWKKSLKTACCGGARASTGLVVVGGSGLSQDRVSRGSVVLGARCELARLCGFHDSSSAWTSCLCCDLVLVLSLFFFLLFFLLPGICAQSVTTIEVNHKFEYSLALSCEINLKNENVWSIGHPISGINFTLRARDTKNLPKSMREKIVLFFRPRCGCVFNRSNNTNFRDTITSPHARDSFTPPLPLST